jgi:rare lipoprotein A
MRVFVAAVLAALTLGLANVGSASAAAPAWQCMGPAASCEKPAPKAHRVAHTAKAKKSYGYKSSSKSTKVASKSAKPGKSYSGGGGSGLASYYWQGQMTASGARFNPSAMTAAHKTLPFGTKVRVTNLHNGRSVTVTINDRGPFVKGRVIDLSSGAAGVIGMKGAGVVPVSMSVLGRG